MNKLLKVLLSIGIIAFSAIPTEFFILFKQMLNPEGFWQKFIFTVVGVYALGAMQIAFLVIGGVLIAYIWKEL